MRRGYLGGYLSYLQGMHGGMHRGMPKVNLKTHFQKNHVLAESLLSRVFSWDVVDVGFPTCLVIALLKIKTNQEKNKALKMSTTKPFSQWTVIPLHEFLKERGVRSSGLKAQLVYRWR
jgi:hypothetical protein